MISRFHVTCRVLFFISATFISVTALSGPPVQLPNTTGINGELTAKHGVDHFFSLWLVFNNDDVIISDKHFTILAPTNNASIQIPSEHLKSHPEAVKKLLLDHVVLGKKLDLGIGADLSVTTLGGRTVNIKSKPTLVANGAKVRENGIDVGNGVLIIVDNYLFPEDISGDHSFLQDMTEVLSFLQGGVRVFQHLLARSNVTKMLGQEEVFTVLVPTDRAFQRWHPIDWGFYPFSVPEFTEMVLMNHFIKGVIKQETLTNLKVVSLGGKEIEFKKANGQVTANGIEVVKGDTPIAKGNIMFVNEVLFVNDEVVAKLHEEHRDKETPPLLAFPWFGSQFLSHAFIAIESTKGFSHIARFLNVADLVPHIPGAGYTFFVPNDEAFKKIGLDTAPDNLLSNKEGLNILLSHFVKGRLYDRDIKDKTKFVSLSNKTLHITRTAGSNGTIEGANIIQKEIFVYNLGTMFYVDSVIFGDEIPRPHENPQTSTPKIEMTTEPQTTRDIELTEDSDGPTEVDLLLTETTTEIAKETTTNEMIPTKRRSYLV